LRDADFVPAEAREAWIIADQQERTLREAYRQLENDTDLTDEARARRAQELYEHSREKVEKARQRARDTLLKHASYAEKNSLPKVNGEPISSSDPTRVLLAQNESERIVRTYERKRTSGGPLRQSASDYLKAEYARGLDVGGVEGAAVASGVLRAADELGVSVEEVAGSLRNEHQREMLDTARRLTYCVDVMPTEAPKPPRSLSPEARKRQGTYRPAPAVLGSNREVVPEKRSSARGKAKSG